MVVSRAVLLLSAIVGTAYLSGCGNNRTSSDAPTDAPTAAQELGALVTVDPVEYLADGLAAREPMIVQHPSGVLFLSGYARLPLGDPPLLWASHNRGATWEPVDVGSVEDGAYANSDVDLDIGSNGTLYFLTMGFDRQTLEGTHVVVGVSRDIGATWAWTRLSETRNDDRPWIEIDPEGTAHAIWNDGAGVSYAVSRDDGQTWTEMPRIHPQGGSSHLAVGPTGELAVSISPLSASGNQFDEGVRTMAISEDGGATWHKRPLPGVPVWSPAIFGPVPRWVEPLAWDEAGTLYHLWSEGNDLWLGRSVDRGLSWETWTIASYDGIAFFPYLIARRSGELAATWFSRDAQTMWAHVAHIQAPESFDGDPTVTLAPPFEPDTWAPGDNGPSRDPAGEYLPVIFLGQSELGVAVPIQNAEAGRLGFSWRRYLLQ